MIPRNFYTLSSRYVEEGESPFSNWILKGPDDGV
jgi:hypothetical protein